MKPNYFVVLSTLASCTLGISFCIAIPSALALSTATNAFGPVGATFDADHRLCVEGTKAHGPFPQAMRDACVEAGGGAAICNGNRWSAAFAKSLRGKGNCPRGTALDSALLECVSGQDIFGPFEKKLVEHCKKMTSGSLVCESQRIHKDFAKSYREMQAPEPQAGSLSVPYFYQYANAYEPGRTCNLTSVAMVAQYYGVNVTPDALYSRAGGPVFTGPDMIWAAGLYGLKGTFSSQASVGTIKAHIDAGRPVIIQGWFTGPGHIMVITGYDDKGWRVNDPAGLWAGCYKCGYPAPTSRNGQGAHYSYAEMAEAATDLGNPSSYWITVLTK